MTANTKVSRFGRCPAKIPTPVELTLVVLRFKYLKFAPMLAICSTESSNIELPLRSKWVITSRWPKRKNELIEELEISKKERQPIRTFDNAKVTSVTVVPDIISFVKATLSPSPSNIVSIVQLLIFRLLRDVRTGNFVIEVQATFKKLNLGNNLNRVAPLLDISVPQRSKYCRCLSP